MPRRSTHEPPALLSRRAWLVGALGTLGASCVRRARFSGPARRVVSLSPSVTEVLFALGAGARVVGVSRYDDYPPEALTLPRVGGMIDPSFEAVVSLRPDALVGLEGPVSRPVLDRVAALGIQVVFVRGESVADLYAAVDRFAQLVGYGPAAPALRASIASEIAAAQALAAGRPSRRVLVLVGETPLVAAGRGSFLDELVGLAGARNVAQGASRWPTLSHEALLALGPELIVDLTAMEGPASNAPWRSDRAIPAVRDGRVVRLEDPVLLRPGPRVGQALARLVRAMHGLPAAP